MTALDAIIGLLVLLDILQAWQVRLLERRIALEEMQERIDA